MDNAQVAIPTIHIPTFIPLAEAAQKYNLSEKALTQLIQTGKIEAVQLPTGELLVAAESNGQKPRTKEEIIAEKFAHLRGQRINAYMAQQTYGIRYQNFIKWARAGYIGILHEEERLIEMDAADVAYCACIYNQKKEEYGGRIAGVKIFDEGGNPYQVKYPDLSARRRM
jgi:predicted site-specific integrase-resolvase